MTASIAGTRIRYDVPSKCKIVSKILTTKFSTAEDQNSFISDLAESIFVNPITIKMWCAKYATTWELGQDLPVGTMSHSFLVVPKECIPKVNKKLKAIRNKIAKVKLTNEISTIKDRNADDLRSHHTPKEVLESLVVNKKAS